MYQKQRKQGPRGIIDKNDIIGLISMIVDCFGKQIHCWKEYLNNPDREIGLPVAPYNKVRKYLSYDNELLCSAFNEGLKRSVDVMFIFIQKFRFFKIVFD